MNQKLRKVLSMVLAMAMILNFALVGTVSPAEAYSPAENKELSRQASADGQVLLENNGALPIAEGTTVALFGRAQIDYVRGGGGSGNTNVEYTRNVLQGMQIKEDEGKIALVPELTAFYTEQVTTNGIKDDASITITDEVWKAAAAATETAVVVIGRYSSEGSDRNASKGDYYLSDAEYNLITRVAAEFDNTIVVLNIGAVMDTSWIKGDNGMMHEPVAGLDAVLCGWQGGMEGGLATADILVGDVNPSGKTVDTWAQDYSYYPSSSTFKESNSYVNYTEDIFVGYRYFETIPGAAEKVNYEFGYGLSYTTFETKVDSVAVEGDEIVVKATVTNTGNVAGKQVVQVYFSAPRGELTKPAKELAAFDKTGLLAPGASEQLTMSFPITDMSSYDDTGVIQKSAYVMEAGDYTFFVGNSIRDGAYSDFVYNVAEDTTVEQLSEKIAPVALKERMIETGEYVKVNALAEELLHHTVAAEGETKIEMEAYIEGSEKLRVESFYDDDFNRLSCLAYMQNAGEYAEYDLNVEAEGQYEMYICYANGYATKNNCLSFTVDGVMQTKATFNAVQTGDGSNNSEWYNFRLAEEPMLINLKEGNNRLRITANVNSQPNFDYMILKRVGNYDGAWERKIPAEGVTKIEAETYDSHIVGVPDSKGKTNPVRIESFTYADGTAAECLAYMNYRGNGVEYYMNVAEAGQYELVLNAANGRAAFDFTPMIKVEPESGNGELFAKTITAERTCGGEETVEGLPNGWYGFFDLEPITINLPKGNVVLSINAQLASFVNVDYFTLEKVGEYVDPTLTISGTEATVIEAEDLAFADWPNGSYPIVFETAPESAGEYAGTTCTAFANHLGNSLTWWLNAEKAGTYAVTLNVANGYEAYTFAPKTTVNGKEVAVSIEIPSTRDDGEGGTGNRWYVFMNAPAFNIVLEEGLNVFTMECVEQDVFPNINTLTFAPVSDNPIVSATGVTKVEAESYTTTNSAPTESFTAGDYAGQSIGMASRGRYVTYDLFVEEAGTYELVLNASNGYAGYELNPGIIVNGEAYPQFVTMPQTCSGGAANDAVPGGWFTFQDIEPAAVYLPAGEITLTLLCGNTHGTTFRYPNLDYFTLEKVSDEIPDRAVEVAGYTVIQAENYTGSSLNDAVVIQDFGDNEYCVAYMNYTGAYVEYELNVTEPGIYDVALCTSYGYNSNAGFIPGIQVIAGDASDANWGMITLERTCLGDAAAEDFPGIPAGWHTYENQAPLSVALPAGECKLRLTAPSTLYPNVDTITLTKIGEYAAPTHKVEGETVIKAIDFNATSYPTSDQPVRVEKIAAGALTGEYCLCFMNYADNAVTYILDVAQAGEYNVTLTAANGRDDFDMNLLVDVNGERSVVPMTIPRTAQNSDADRWYRFIGMEPFTVTLEEGINYLTFTCETKDKFPNIYDITLAPKAEATTVDAAAEKLMLVDVYNGGKDENGKYILMDEFVAQLSVEDLANLLSARGNRDGGNTQGWGKIEEFGIPLVMTADGPQGIRISAKCTAWPISTNLSCTWDVDLVAAVGTAAATEAHYHNMDIWLAPGMNIHRDPLCGRNFEYYSEDPLVTGKMAASITRAVQAEGVAISLKHFAFNNKETNRSSSDSRVTERAAREIYLRGFEIAVKEADPWTIMSSYNFINGIETAECWELITGILRNEWGYNGVVETDWGNQSNHVLEVLAGNDVKMTNSQPEKLVAAVESGKLTRENLEAGAIRVLELIMKVNYFQDKFVNIPIVDIDTGTNFKAAENIIWSATIQTEETSDTDGGMNVGYCDAGAYAEYQINVVTGGTYKIQARVASSAGKGAFNVVIDGETIASFDVPNTGAYQNWTTINTVENATVHLEEGRHTMRFEWTESGSNLNWLLFNLEEADETDPTDPIDPSEPGVDNEELKAAVEAAQAAQAAAEAAQKSAEEAEAAAEAAQAQIAADKAAAEAAQAAAEAAKKLAEDAKAAADAAKAAAEAANAEAAQEALDAAASAAAAAEASAAAAKAAETAQKAQAAAEDAAQAAEDAADAAADDKTAAEAAKAAAETAKEQADAAAEAAYKAQKAAEDAAKAAEDSNVAAAEEAKAAAKSAQDSANSAAAAAESAQDSANSAKAAAEAQKKAEDAQKAAEDAANQAAADKAAAEAAKKAAEEAEAEAKAALAESALNLAKMEALMELNEYYEDLKATASEVEKAALAEAVLTAREDAKAAADTEALAEAVEAGIAALDNALCAAKNFTDVDLDAWYHPAVDFVLKEGIMNGNTNGTFAPEDSLTRAMLVQILYNIEGRPEVETDKSFTDVTEDDWYFNAIMWAAENEIVLGYQDGSFGAEDNVTREQMVTILYRYAGEPDVTAQEIVFADSDQISEWAVDAVLWAYENKLVQGVGNDMFDPAGDSQRAAAAQIMMNYFTK